MTGHAPVTHLTWRQRCLKVCVETQSLTSASARVSLRCHFAMRAPRLPESRWTTEWQTSLAVVGFLSNLGSSKTGIRAVASLMPWLPGKLGIGSIRLLEPRKRAKCWAPVAGWLCFGMWRIPRLRLLRNSNGFIPQSIQVCHSIRGQCHQLRLTTQLPTEPSTES